jgi:phosphoglycolate phosphatase-like HAD superfamily hydrolase
MSGPRADPAECLYCGESAVEILVAQRAGMRGVRVTVGGAADTGRLVDILIEAGLLHSA